MAGLSAGGTLPPTVVDFESFAMGTTFGVPTHEAGEFAFSQNDVLVHVDPLIVRENPQETVFFQAIIGGAAQDDFPTTPLYADNIAIRFEFSELDFLVTSATLEYKILSEASVQNLAVNGGDVFVGLDLGLAPSEIAPGITAMVDGGLITLSADPGFSIFSLVIGGQELGIDNLVAVPEPGALVLLGVGCLVVSRRPSYSHNSAKWACKVSRFVTSSRRRRCSASTTSGLALATNFSFDSLASQAAIWRSTPSRALAERTRSA